MNCLVRPVNLWLCPWEFGIYHPKCWFGLRHSAPKMAGVARPICHLKWSAPKVWTELSTCMLVIRKTSVCVQFHCTSTILACKRLYISPKSRCKLEANEPDWISLAWAFQQGQAYSFLVASCTSSCKLVQDKKDWQCQDHCPSQVSRPTSQFWQ